MKTTGEIEEAMRNMGRRARQTAAARHALTKEQLAKIQAAVRGESSTKSAALIPSSRSVGDKIADKGAGALSTLKKPGTPLMSKQLLDRVVQEIRSATSGQERRQRQRIRISLKPYGDAAKADKAINRYFELKEKLNHDLGTRSLTSSQAEGQLAKAREHLKNKLLASGAIKIENS